MMFLALLLTLQAFSEASEVKSQVPLFPLPAVDFSDLSVLDELAVSTVANALTTGRSKVFLFLLKTDFIAHYRYIM